MKNVMVANFNPKGSWPKETLERYIKAQLENSLRLGWSPEDIVLLANFDFEFSGIRARKVALNSFCFTGSKMFAIRELLTNSSLPAEEVLWVHDLDLWQNAPITVPEFRDLGICTYSIPKYNGGCVFYRPAAADIVQDMVEEIRLRKSNKEEPIINDLLRRPLYKERVTVLNCTYNVGCSGYKERYSRSEKPLKGLHFHPTNRIAWDTHARNRNGIGVEATMSAELREVLVKYFGDRIANYAYEDSLSPFEVRLTGVDRTKRNAHD